METTLKNGIAIKKDEFLSGYDITQKSKFMELSYSSDMFFFLNLKGFWLSEEESHKYKKEFEEMQLAMIEANEWLATQLNN